MILIFHIIVALASLIYAGVIFFNPSQSRLNATYGLVAATFTSGFYLVFSKPVSITQTCVTGLVYLAFVSFAIVSARHKLAA